jgi:hypothetical protein
MDEKNSGLRIITVIYALAEIFKTLSQRFNPAF